MVMSPARIWIGGGAAYGAEVERAEVANGGEKVDGDRMRVH